METLRGAASHCQLTSRTSSGGNNGASSTTFIALFRVGQRQVQFPSGTPLSISDGDEVVVAGQSWRRSLAADAVHNVTTGLPRQAGIVSRIFVSLFLPVFVAAFGLVARNFLNGYGWWVVFGGFVLGSFYVLFRAVQTFRAWSYVKSTVP